MNELCHKLHQFLSSAKQAKARADQVMHEHARGEKPLKRVYGAIKVADRKLKAYEKFCRTTTELLPGGFLWAPEYIALEILAKQNGIEFAVLTSKIFYQDIKDTRLIKIDFSGMMLKTLGNTLDGMRELRTLDLTLCKLGSLKDLEGIASQIAEINLSRNSISSLAGLEKFTNLRKLRLDSNNIGSIEELKNLTKLESVNLKNNMIRNIDILSSLPRLSWLDISGNLITDAHIEEARSLLPQLSAKSFHTKDQKPYLF